MLINPFYIQPWAIISQMLFRWMDTPVQWRLSKYSNDLNYTQSQFSRPRVRSTPMRLTHVMAVPEIQEETPKQAIRMHCEAHQQKFHVSFSIHATSRNPDIFHLLNLKPKQMTLSDARPSTAKYSPQFCCTVSTRFLTLRFDFQWYSGHNDKAHSEFL